jgi:hypothetical protein
MATLDFTPLFRSSVGFDRLPSLLSHALERDEGGYPPYNIEKSGQDQHRIVLALAGFSKDDVEVVVEHNSAASSKTLPDRRTCTAALPAEASSASSTLPTTSRLQAPRWVTDY